MASLKTTTIVALTAAGLLSGGIAAPAFAGEVRAPLDTSRLDKAPAEYSYYRGRGWRGNRGAAVAAGVGLGILGAAAIAASRPAYADPYYGYDEGYSYGAYEPAYAYEAPPPVVYRPAPRYYGGYYGPGNYYSGRGPYTGFYNGAPDPSRGGK